MPVQAKTDIQAGDDDFEAYRKRMMLGYKHRYKAWPLPGSPSLASLCKSKQLPSSSVHH